MEGNRPPSFFGNHVSEPTNAEQLAQLEASAAFVETLGVDTFDYQPDPGPRTAQLVDILESGARVLMIEGEPMEVAYRAQELDDPALHANIRLLSHSSWNKNRDQNGGRTWDDIETDFPGVMQIDIRDQNAGSNDEQGFYNNAWNQMDGSEDPIITAARAAMGPRLGNCQRIR